MSRSRRMPPLFEVMRETNPPRGPLPPPTPVHIPRYDKGGAAPVVRSISTPPQQTGPSLSLHKPSDDTPATPEPPEAPAAATSDGGVWDLNRPITLPAKTLLFAVAGIIVLLAGVWYAGWQLGAKEEKAKHLPAADSLSAPTDPPGVAPDPLTQPPQVASTPPQQPRQQPAATPSASRTQATQPSQQPPAAAAGLDPRGTGLNYLCIVSPRNLEDADAVAAFLTRNGVPAGVVPIGKVDMATARANNHRGWEVFALEGVPSGQFRASAAKRRALEQKVEALEAQLNRELKSNFRLRDHLWKKY